MLAGCSTTAPIITTTTKFVEPPSVLLRDCSIPQPPSKTSYLKSDFNNREKLLADYSLSQITSLGECNIDKAALRSWVVNQKKIYQSE